MQQRTIVENERTRPQKRGKKYCTECEVELNPDPEKGNVYTYYDKKRHRRRMQAVCKECQVGRNRESRTKKARAHIAALPPVGDPNACGACGASRGRNPLLNIVGDVNQATGRRYGYLCISCRNIVREVGEDIVRMRAVLAYLELTRQD